MASARLQSPPFVANNDELERTQARAARAASIRRRSTLLSPRPLNHHRPIDKDKAFLNHDQITDLFQNCIKLASENKINQKNTWELGLIDHLSEIVRVRSKDEDSETNFLKASCTLEAGVKIYSLRVDSVHSEAYRVLGGINRGACQVDDGNIEVSDRVKTMRAEESPKKDLERKLSPLSTLESSYEALNIKKYDVAFTVDPLYHQMSAQFDEGGAKGLLLYNLGVYGGCSVLFDSSEFPEKNILSQPPIDDAEVIDLSFIKDIIDQMMIHVPVSHDISPTLSDILHQFDENNCRPSEFFDKSDKLGEETTDNNVHSEVEDDAFDNFQSLNIDQYDLESFDYETHGDNCTSKEANYTEHPNVNGACTNQDINIDLKLEKLVDFLSLGLRLTSKSNAWAGPDHWKFQKVRGNPCLNSETEYQLKKQKAKKEASDLSFAKWLDTKFSTGFAVPKNPKSLCKVNRGPCNVTLPEDCHYMPESLVKLFLLPNVTCFGRKARKCSGESRHMDDYDISPSWDHDNIIDDHFDYPICNSNNVAEEPGTLVRPQRQVTKAEVKYDKTSRQVDVHALKDLLWSNIQNIVPAIYTGNEATVSLRQILHQFWSKSCENTISHGDISPHLFFICLLHLANEHNLSLHDTPTMDELTICIPRAAFAG